MFSAPPTTYTVVNRPLGANLSDTLKNRIRRGDYVNIQHLLTDDGDFDEQRHQRMTLEVRSIGQEEALSVVKPNHTKEITTTGQFTIYAAVLTDHSPQHQVYSNTSQTLQRWHAGLGVWHGKSMTKVSTRKLKQMGYTLARSTGMHGSAVWNKMLTTKQSVIPFVGKSTEAGVVSSAVQPSVTSCSKKASASSSSSLAAAPNLRVTSNMLKMFRETSHQSLRFTPIPPTKGWTHNCNTRPNTNKL